MKLFSLILGLLILGAGFFMVGRVQATQELQVTICHYPPGNPNNPQTITIALSALATHLGHGDHVGACASPSPSVSPSPSASPSPSPIVDPCDGECPSPTPVPEATSSAEPGHEFLGATTSGASYSPPSCNGVPSEPFTIDSVVIKDSSHYEFFWTNKGDADHYSIIYGYTPDNMIYGIPDLPGNAKSVTLGELIPNSHLFAQVFAYRNNCSVSSNVLDP